MKKKQIKHAARETQASLYKRLCEEKDARIAELTAHIALLEKQNEELKALFNKTSQFEVIEQGEDRLTLKMKPVTLPQGGRAGFRAKRTAMEEQTHSTKNDSVAELERRAAEG